MSIVVDQLELAVAEEGWGAGLLGGGVGAALDAGAGGGFCAAVSEVDEPVTDPNQRVRRLPLLLGFCSPATEVLQALGDALAVRAGGSD